MTDEREIKKCPKCGNDFWRDEMARTGYCVPCDRIRSRVSATKTRKKNPEAFNEYHREYARRKGISGGRTRYSDQHAGGGT